MVRKRQLDSEITLCSRFGPCVIGVPGLVCYNSVQKLAEVPPVTHLGIYKMIEMN